MSALRSRIRTAALFAAAGALLGAALGLGVGTAGVAAAQTSVTVTTTPVGTPLDWYLPRCLESTVDMAREISECMVEVMHPRGSQGSGPVEVDVNSAALLCRRTRSSAAPCSICRA